MKIEYNIDDLRQYSEKLLAEHEAMVGAVTNLEGLVSSFQANWSGEAQTAYIAFFTDTIASLKSYLEEFDIIAQNLNTAADYYEKHEETYTNCLGF